jgi:hypothetical protein
LAGRIIDEQGYSRLNRLGPFLGARPMKRRNPVRATCGALGCRPWIGGREKTMAAGWGPDIVREGEAFVVDAALVAPKFGLSVDAFRAELAAGGIVTLCERGLAEDAGRFRLTFRRGRAAWRFVLEADGGVSAEPILARTLRR